VALIVWGAAIVVALLVLDRILLRAEARGWINYRKVGLSRGGASYPTLQLSSIFEPGFGEIMEVKYADEKAQDDSGGPPGTRRDSAATGCPGTKQQDPPTPMAG